MSYTELKYNHPVGRKQYRCEWCGEIINTGEKHLYRSYIFEGRFNSGRMHLECEFAMSKVNRDELSEGWMPGDYPRGHPEYVPLV